jgi:hypothetical protein
MSAPIEGDAEATSLSCLSSASRVGDDIFIGNPDNTATTMVVLTISILYFSFGNEIRRA